MTDLEKSAPPPVIQQPGYAAPQGGQGYAPPPGYQQQASPPGAQPYPPPGQPGQPYAAPQPYMQPGQPMQPMHPQQPGVVMQQPGVIMQQPGYNNPMGQSGEVWMMPPPAAPPNCPPGLEYMTQIDQLLVKQQVELLEVVSGFETNNKYKIKNSLGQNVYYAVEDTDCCTRQCCGPMREFNMKVFDNANNEVIHLYRPFRCTLCCCPCFLQEIEVQSPPGTPIGYVIQKWSICTPGCKPQFEITDAQRNPILKIEGPLCVIACCMDVDFKVLALDGVTEVGKVTKQWGGIVKEAFTDADTFGITFPMDLDVKAKATMLGAVMLIDFIYFESNQNNNNQ